ncbi:MAG: hypothetical protein ACJ72Q_19460 [Nitrososphaeraceae archaeon]
MVAGIIVVLPKVHINASGMTVVRRHPTNTKITVSKWTPWGFEHIIFFQYLSIDE